MKVFFVRKDSPFWEEMKKSFPIKDGAFIALNDEQFASLKEDLVIQQVGEEKVMMLHVKALAAHCECLAMNASNCIAALTNVTPPYGDHEYNEVLKKWGLVDEGCKPLIVV